jgi:CheY-like chemotaxis protein
MLLTGRTVAFADSSPIIRRVLQLACEELGIEGLDFSSPQALINVLGASCTPDVVLVNATDLGPDGHLVGQTIRSKCRQTKVFLLKDTMVSLNARVEVQAGIDGVYKKPFSTDELFSEIAQLL